MKVILLNGSPHPKGNTYQALSLCAETLAHHGIEAEILQLGASGIHGCIGCGSCYKRENNTCVFTEDCLNDYSMKIREADGLIVGSPVYYAGMAGDLKSFLDRLFYSSGRYMRFKPAAAIAIARRAGTTSTFDQINHYFALGEMLNVPTSYWSDIYGAIPGQIHEDEEGKNHMATIAKNMAWLLKTLEAGKKEVPLPEATKTVRTNFIR